MNSIRDTIRLALWSALEERMTEGPTYDLNDAGENLQFGALMGEVADSVIEALGGVKTERTPGLAVTL